MAELPSWLNVTNTIQSPDGLTIVCRVRPQHPAFWLDAWRMLGHEPIYRRLWWFGRILVAVARHALGGGS